tara:strand:+ start:227 stop:556 length:330 start_codon:yes stop_codon:yes gene_type:complete
MIKREAIGGPDVGSGWFSLIRSLSEGIEEWNREHPESESASVLQIKEKFGTLRFYVFGGDPNVITPLIREAETLSSTTCQDCGVEGINEPNDGGWWNTLCVECRTKRDS